MAVRSVNLALFLAAVATIAVVVNVLAAHPSLRWRADATKTRAYSLSEQTLGLIENLEGEWTIVLVMSDDAVDDAVRRQVGQVLQRYERASSHISVVRIDPADPASLDQYEAELTRLREIYRDQIARYDAVLAEARDALARFTVFLQEQSAALVALRQAIEPEDAAAAQVDQLIAVMALRLEQARQVETELDRALALDEGRPLPDYETARSILAVSLETWAGEFFQIVQLLGTWRDSPATGPAVRRYAGGHRQDHGGWAQELANQADPLKHLPPLELARIGRSLESGETAIVSGPDGATAIPSGQLFARLNLRQGASGEVSFDQRFRGEQAISAAIRVLQGKGAMPLVVLVHAQDETLLARRVQNIDFVGAADMLRGARFEVWEWNAARSSKPATPRDRDVAWVVVPPPIPQRKTLQVTDDEQALIEATRDLLRNGESVLLSFAPSPVSRTGKRDPWRQLVTPFGLDVDTGQVVFESVRDDQGRQTNQRVVQLIDYPPDHAIGSAVHGLQTLFDLPLAITLVDPAESAGFEDVRRVVVARIEPQENRWLESNWMASPASLDEPQASQRVTEPLPLVVAVERRNPVGPGPQRLLVVGSGGWLLSYLADVVVNVGGDRMALVNPGNHELLMAGVAWLANADDLIAASPVSRQVARLDGVTGSVQTLWRWIALAIIPGACLGLGIFTWAARRY